MQGRPGPTCRCGRVRQLVAGDDVVKLIDEGEDFGRAIVARPRQVILDDRANAAGIGAENHDAVGHVDDFLDVVADHDDRGGVLVERRPDVDDFRPQAFGGERVDVAERLVHEEDFGIDRQRAGHADALLHAAGELARIGIFEAGEADHADHALGPLVDFGRRDARGLEDDADVLGDGQPRDRGRSFGRRWPRRD